MKAEPINKADYIDRDEYSRLVSEFPASDIANQDEFERTEQRLRSLLSGELSHAQEAYARLLSDKQGAYWKLVNGHADTRSRVLLDGLGFTESPRWHDGRLWFVDMYRGEVKTVDLDGRAEMVAKIDDEASGLSFLPDGSLIVVSMRNRQLLRVEGGRVTVHADLSRASRLNDMMVDVHGRAYVDFRINNDIRAENSIAVVEPNGEWRLAAEHVASPNGMVITPDGKSLICGSTRYRQLTIFSIEKEGGLSEPRVWADTSPHTPDGICLDVEGAVWIGGLRTGAFVRMLPGGAAADTISVGDRWAVACALGGRDGRTLLMATCDPKTGNPAEGTAYIEMAEVDVPRAGWHRGGGGA